MKKKILIAVLAVISCICCAFGVAACGGEDDNGGQNGEHIHSYGEPVWTWADDYSSATATFTCTECGDEQVKNAYITSSTEGTTITYTATVTFSLSYTDTKTVTVSGGEHTHEYGAWTVTTIPTETETGMASRTCTAGDSVDTISLPALSDGAYTLTNNTATATEEGTATYTITINGEDISFTAATSALGEHTHVYGDPVWAWADDYSSATVTITCASGDDVQVLTAEVESDTDDDKITYTATAEYNGEVYSDTKVVDIIAEEHVHAYGAWTVTTIPTETETGTVSRSCVDGDDTQTLTLPVLGDSGYTLTDNTATITSAGTATYTITVNGNKITFTAATAKLDHTHSYGDWEVTKIPTTATKGSAARTCTYGDDVQTIDLPELGDSGYVLTEDGGNIKYSITLTYDGSNYTISFTAEGTLSCTVTFVSGGETISTQTVTSGGTVTSYSPATQSGKYFSGWYTDSSYTAAFDFTTAITSDITLYAKWDTLDSAITYLQGGYESIAVEWEDTNASGASVLYKLSSESSWHYIDDSNIRSVDSATLRADVLGLAGGETYDIRVLTSGNVTINQYNISVTAYDRSGYAHYNYTDGVGAYNDDGTLKDGALVIYLTEENKNDVSNDCYVYDASTQTYTKEDITQYLYCSVSANISLYGSGAMVGIGEILNNRRYSGSDRYNVGIAKLCEVYGAVVVRVVGTVTADVNSDGTSTITGLTDYDSTGNGGSTGDNGRMARMTNASNLTIEGVGEDASIYGWGLHFIASNTGTYEGSGKGFEVRNITFEAYPEDAIGMEGVQGTSVSSDGSISGSASADADLLASVERCWIHNNSFLPGYCANPAESDKSEGDGSCDFKRGQYYTLSYNYFEYCHKTNLIGSSDTSLQFNISMHHNYWYNCGSRIPLVRRANVHFYNNYIYGDSTDSSASLSYVASARANSYLFAEANYYDGTKNPVQIKSGGVVKEYNNVYYAATGDNYGTTVTSRTEEVSNSCTFSYYGIDYSSFDTDSSLFYYDDVNKCSNCYITDAVTARQVVMQTAGVQKRSTETVDTSMSTNKDKVTSSVNAAMGSNDSLTVDLSAVTSAGTTLNNIYFSAKYASGGIKGKGQVITFKLTSEMDVTVTVSGTAEANLGELVSDDGTVYGSKFTSITVTLPAGTYFIGAGDKSKEVCVTELIFKDGTTDEEKVANVESLIGAIGTVTLESGDKITLARSAYDSLTTALKLQVTNYSTLFAAENAYSYLQIDNVISLIDAIGTVSENSGSAITAARAAYNSLTATQQTSVTNYSTLTAAEEAYESFAVTAVINAIAALADVSTLTTQSQLEAAQDAYEAAQKLYVALEDDQQTQVTNYSKLTQGLADIAQALKLYEFIEAVDDLPTTITTSETSAMAAAVTLYNSLTSEQIATLSSSYASTLSKYNTLYAEYSELMSQSVVGIFAEGVELPTNFSVSNGNYKSGVTFEYNGTTYSKPLKMESKTEITVTVATTMTMTIYLDTASVKIKIDGTTYTADSNGVVTITLSAGTHTITKGDTCNLCYITLTP